jgi:homotetrameric cytidine deaminase
VTESHTRLIEAACEARIRSYAPYSGFRVGAALLAADGRVFTGGNVENASYGLSICAERSAVFRAVAEGQREFTAIAICADDPRPTPPCGACRQVLLEFAPGMTVLLAGAQGLAGEVVTTTLAALLPRAFRDFPGHRHGDLGGEGR